MDIFSEIIFFFFSSIPDLYVQDFQFGGDSPKFFDNKGMDPQILVWILVSLALIIFGLVYGLHRYNKWKKFKAFEDEMRTLDLNPDDESTFAGMVKRFEMEEPVNVLMSARLFDEMATKEIEKVLGSSGSKSSKENFIQQVYRIRTKTYHPDWLRTNEMEVPVLSARHPKDAESEMAVS